MDPTEQRNLEGLPLAGDFRLPYRPLEYHGIEQDHLAMSSTKGSPRSPLSPMSDALAEGMEFANPVSEISSVVEDVEAQPISKSLTSKILETSSPVPSKLIEPSTPPLLPSWQPIYIRKSLILSFISFMFALFLALTVLYTLSRRNAGFLPAGSTLQPLWRFGPVSVFTLTSICWFRVEREGLRYAAWIKLYQHQQGSVTASQTLCLNYFSIPRLLAPFKAARSGDWLVFLLTLIAIMLQVEAIISASLFTLRPVEVFRHGRDVTITSSFVDHLGPGIVQDWQALYTLHAVRSYGVPYLDGTGPGFAYQGFTASGEDPAYLALEAKVQILRPDVRCKLGNITSYTGYRDDDNGVDYELLTIETPHCSESVTFPVENMSQDRRTMHRLVYSDYASDMEPQLQTCDNGTVHFAYWGAELANNDTNASRNTTLRESSVVTCQIGATITSGNVMRTENSSSYSLDPDAPTVPVSFDVTRLIHSMGSPIGSSGDTNWSMMWVEIEPEREGHEWQPVFPVQPLEDDFDPQSLVIDAVALEFVTSSFMHVIPLAARYLAMEDVSMQTSGSILVTESRLHVETLQYAIITGFLWLILSCSLASLYLITSKPFSARRDPATTLNYSIILANNPTLREQMAGTGSMSEQDVVRTLSQQHLSLSLEGISENHSPPAPRYVEIIPATRTSGAGQPVQRLAEPEKKTIHTTVTATSPTVSGRQSNQIQWYKPWQLRVWIRWLFVLLVAIIASTIGVSWHFSQKNEGFADIGEDTFWSLLWASIPTLIAVLIGLYLTGASMQVQVITPFAFLKNGCEFKTLRSSMDNPYSALKGITQTSLRFAILIGLSCATAAIVLPPLGGSLLVVHYVTRDSVALLQQEESISTTRPPPSIQNTPNGPMMDGIIDEDVALISGLVLFRNYSYPDWTFEDLVFPRYSVKSIPSTYSSETSIQARVPAVRPELTCETLDQSQIDLALSKPQDELADLEGAYILTMEPDAPSEMFGTPNDTFAVCDDDLFFGRREIPPPGSPTTVDVVDRSFVWGSIENGRVTYLKWMICRLGIVDIDVDITLRFPELELDTNRPPRVVESSKQQSPLLTWYNGEEQFVWDMVTNFDTGIRYRGRTESDCTRQKNAGLKLEMALMHPLFGEPDPNWLVDESKTARVEAAWKKLSTILVGQMINLVGYRVPFRAYPNPRQIEATFTDYRVRRLMQNSIVTWIIVGVLLVIMLLTIVGIFTESNMREVLPKNPQSIGAVASLWADSNIFDFFPEDIISVSDEELERRFQGKIFKMGWTKVADEMGEREHFAINMEMSG